MQLIDVMTDKPLFIPLKTEYFLAFKQRLKEHELRLYGSRWNEKTCRIGRLATLSKGYGKHERITRSVAGFERKALSELSEADRAAFTACYGEDANDVAVIWLPAV